MMSATVGQTRPAENQPGAEPGNPLGDQRPSQVLRLVDPSVDPIAAPAVPAASGGPAAGLNAPGHSSGGGTAASVTHAGLRTKVVPLNERTGVTEYFTAKGVNKKGGGTTLTDAANNAPGGPHDKDLLIALNEPFYDGTDISTCGFKPGSRILTPNIPKTRAMKEEGWFFIENNAPAGSAQLVQCLGRRTRRFFLDGTTKEVRDGIIVAAIAEADGEPAMVANEFSEFETHDDIYEHLEVHELEVALKAYTCDSQEPVDGHWTPFEVDEENQDETDEQEKEGEVEEEEEEAEESLPSTFDKNDSNRMDFGDDEGGLGYSDDGMGGYSDEGEGDGDGEDEEEETSEDEDEDEDEDNGDGEGMGEGGGKDHAPGAGSSSASVVSLASPQTVDQQNQIRDRSAPTLNAQQNLTSAFASPTPTPMPTEAAAPAVASIVTVATMPPAPAPLAPAPPAPAAVVLPAPAIAPAAPTPHASKSYIIKSIARLLGFTIILLVVLGAIFITVMTFSNANVNNTTDGGVLCIHGGDVCCVDKGFNDGFGVVVDDACIQCGASMTCKATIEVDGDVDLLKIGDIPPDFAYPLSTSAKAWKEVEVAAGIISSFMVNALNEVTKEYAASGALGPEPSPRLVQNLALTFGSEGAEEI